MVLYIALLYLFYPIWVLLAPAKKIGGKRARVAVKQYKKVIFCCNHRAISDLFVTATATRKYAHYMVKKEWVQSSFFSRLLVKIFSAIQVERGAADLAAFRSAKKYLGKNQCICIFPEGTRSKGKFGPLGEIRQGALMFSVKFDTPIVPMYVYKKPRFLGFGNAVLMGDAMDMSAIYAANKAADPLGACADALSNELNKLRLLLDRAIQSKGKERRKLFKRLRNPAFSTAEIYDALKEVLPPLPPPVRGGE